jgi:hypothetical protein
VTGPVDSEGVNRSELDHQRGTDIAGPQFRRQRRQRDRLVVDHHREGPSEQRLNREVGRLFEQPDETRKVCIVDNCRRDQVPKVADQGRIDEIHVGWSWPRPHD